MTNCSPIEVDIIPKNPSKGTTFLIRSNQITDYTHGIFRYPCKYIPHVPRWFLTKYSNINSKKYGVLDPFVGSGTTLVESSLMNIPSYGIDVDPLSCLLSKVKTTRFSNKEIDLLNEVINKLDNKLKISHSLDSAISKHIPKFETLNYWFSREAINDLAIIKYYIEHFYKKTNNKKIRDFLLITLASIIRKASYAEEQSPKPYISKRIKKRALDTKDLFLSNLKKYSDSIFKFSSSTNIPAAKTIGYDARNINKKAIKQGKIHLAMTSPPYINAFDYVRSLKLENVWLNLITEDDIPRLYDKQIGTEKIHVERYNTEKPQTGINSLDKKLADIYKIDKKRAYVVADFFKAMSQNIQEIHNILINNGYYCIVAGDSKIRDVKIPTSRIFIDIAKRKGFNLVDDFSYIIRNRYLRIPRKGRGGFIPKDHIIVFNK